MLSVCRRSPITLRLSEREELTALLAGLSRLEAVPDDLPEFGEWFRVVHWPGRGSGPPLIKHILSRWEEFLAWREENRPRKRARERPAPIGDGPITAEQTAKLERLKARAQKSEASDGVDQTSRIRGP